MITKALLRASLLAILITLPIAVMAQSTDDLVALRKRVEAYKKVWNTHDASALAAFFTEDADMIMYNVPAMQGRQAIQDWWAAYFARNEKERKITIAIETIRVITPEVALINVATTTAGLNNVGQELLNRFARGTWIVVRKDDEWLISAMRGLPTKHDRIIRASDKNPLEVNKELVRQMDEEVWNKGNLEILDELYSPNFVWHFLPSGNETIGLDSLRKHVKNHREAFPDWREKIKHIVAEGDFVVIHFVSTGTNNGSFLGNAPTGKWIHINEMSIFRIEDGKIAEQWLIPDLLSLNQQLGLIPQSN